MYNSPSFLKTKTREQLTTSGSVCAVCGSLTDTRGDNKQGRVNHTVTIDLGELISVC